MNIQLRFFASVREALGTSQEILSVPEHVRTLGDLRQLLRERGGVWSDTLAEGRALRMACNQQMADAGAVLSEGCEVAFFPPVTGG
jgi:molybdopterin synthase sulfur carrier subunit